MDKKPDVVAGHSLGEYSALVANKALSFEQGLQLVSKRAHAMQSACEEEKSSMLAVMGLEEQKVDEICRRIAPNLVVAGYNSPEQVVISGPDKCVRTAKVKIMASGARSSCHAGCWRSVSFAPDGKCQIRIAKSHYRYRFL